MDKSQQTIEAVIKAHAIKIMAQEATLTDAAQVLGVDVVTLYRWRHQWGLVQRPRKLTGLDKS